MKQTVLVTCFFIYLTFISATVTASAAPSHHGEANLEKPGIYVELGASSDPNAIGCEVGFFGYENENLSYVGGLGFLASESFEDLFVGANLGIRFSVGNVISPYVGMGVFAGYSEENVGADDDNEDNDDDGFVDEEGEEKEVINNLIGSLYPEIGVQIWTTTTSRLTFSGKYHMTTEGRENDFWMYSFGFGFLFE
jgi:opacity protein-like surface antigen